MTDIMKYTLKEITEISYSGFYFEIPKDTRNIINYLSSQIGTNGISTDVFVKVAPTENKPEKKRRGNKAIEVSADDWESIRTFQTTKIEHKTGIEGDINELRLYLNKLSDNTFLDLREKIIEKINQICLTANQTDIEKLGNILYDICSTNKFYSKIFAALFANLITMYPWLNTLFQEKRTNIMELYNNITYVDSDKDYDGFCEMNKQNEKRRAITTFYLNMALYNNEIMPKKDLIKILSKILTSIVSMIYLPNKKNEVDELTEIVGILFQTQMIEEVTCCNPEEYYVSDCAMFKMEKETTIDFKCPILVVINQLAQKKAKDYPSLSNKSIFKYMDLVEM